ncbi:MAG: hypothetical protein ACI87E_000047 [Mariniblastus sp.]|jgi:hypothetical protein
MDRNLYQTLGQVSSEKVGQIFREPIRGCFRFQKVPQRQLFGKSYFAINQLGWRVF